MIKTERDLCRFAAALVSGEEDTIRACIQSAVSNGVTQLQLREVILTSYLFDGYPTALEGYRILADMYGSAADNAVDLYYSPENIETWRKRGEPLCRTIYGDQFEKLRNRVTAIAPELSDAMMVEGYGKVLSREGLEPRLRELCVVTILTVKKRPRQLLSHSLGALRLGATADQLQVAFEAVSGKALLENVEVWNRIMGKISNNSRLP